MTTFLGVMTIIRSSKNLGHKKGHMIKW